MKPKVTRKFDDRQEARAQDFLAAQNEDAGPVRQLRRMEVIPQDGEKRVNVVKLLLPCDRSHDERESGDGWKVWLLGGRDDGKGVGNKEGERFLVQNVRLAYLARDRLCSFHSTTHE